MLISFSWLKEHVALSDSETPEAVAEKLKLSTVEVEGITRTGQSLENIVVGKVLTAEKHPTADRLKVCTVDVGSEKLEIVCGGSNVSAGMLVIVAKVGARVKWHGEGELVEMKPTKIRGVESNGMICGADEVGLPDRFPKKEEKEIVDVSGLKVKPGTPLAAIVGQSEVVLEIDNKSLSNRPDLWGHYGLAREVAVLTNRPLKPYVVKSIKKGSGFELAVSVVEQQWCSRYMAVAMSGVTVAPSPAWLQKKLTAVGVRPINNIVDALNYVMLDCGQPLHAFDARHLSNGIIVVRPATAGETITTLDEKNRKLSPDMLVIANKEKPVALAGIMGGLVSGVQADTTTIVIESANFNATAIRKTTTKLGLRTDASARFEKGLDPNLCEVALQKVVALLVTLNKTAKVTSKVVDVSAGKRMPQQLEMPVSFFEKKLGVAVPAKTVRDILTHLGFGIKEKKDILFVTIPTWRAKDVTCPEDLVEEVVRIYGYDNIPASLPVFPITPPEKNTLQTLERELIDTLVKEESFSEVYNYSFVSDKQIENLGDTKDRYLALDNPLSSEKPYLRRSLLPNLLENVAEGSANRTEIKLVEVGKVFRPEESGLRAANNGDELLPVQDTYLTAVYSNKKDTNPFMKIRQALEAMIKLLGSGVLITSAKEAGIGRHPVRNADVLYRGQVVGSLFELHPLASRNFGIESRVGVLKLNLTKLAEQWSQPKTSYQPLPSYPEVRRDIAILVKKDMIFEQVEKVLKQADPLLVAHELFDVYEGASIGKENKSLALHLTFGNPERTLTSEEVDKAYQKITESLAKKLQAEVRT